MSQTVTLLCSRAENAKMVMAYLCDFGGDSDKWDRGCLFHEISGQIAWNDGSPNILCYAAAFTVINKPKFVEYAKRYDWVRPELLVIVVHTERGMLISTFVGDPLTFP